MEVNKKQLPLLIGAITALLIFAGCEYIRRQPDKATQQLDEVLKRDKQIECEFLRKQNSAEYDKKCS
jgi:hypothetical protein